MEQFNVLPFQQKIAVLVGVSVALAGLFYYSQILPIQDEAQQSEQNQAQMKSEVSKLKAELAKSKVQDRKKAREDLEAERSRFAEMLPKAEELVRFITNISDTANAAGLSVSSFEKGDVVEYDYYLELPIEMEVSGTYRTLVGFLQTIAGKDKRVVNIRNLQISRDKLPIGPLVAKYQADWKARQPEHLRGRKLTEGQQRTWRAKAYDELVERGVTLSATFTAAVFTYTGKPAGATALGKMRDKQKTLHTLRAKMLGVL